ncbi:hypothetical protein QG37_00699 [Candidozyma auris]|nr:hypothetical protein QG37_00699 [[Candida] auris]
MLNHRKAETLTETIHESNNSRRLYFYHEIDSWQQDNHFIRYGYIKETRSFKECIKSLTYWHNESINIYSHLVPSMMGLFFISHYLSKMPKFENYLGIWEIFNFYQFGIAATFCLGSSASFHCFKCHSPKVSKAGNQCDYFGIIVLITCSLNSIVLFTFYDLPSWRNAFIGLFCAFALMCTKVTFDVRFSTPAYRPFRSCMFIMFGLSGVLPVFTAVAKFGLEEAEKRANALWLVGEGFFYIFGASLYAARIPERFFHAKGSTAAKKHLRGKFDFVGHSHQIFHFMVVIAAYCHWKALIGCYIYLHEVVLESHHT